MSDEKNQTDQILDLVNEDGTASSNMASIAAKPTGLSRTELMAKMVDYAAKASKEDLAAFIASVGTAEYMPGQTTPAERFDANKAAQDAVGDMSQKNMATIKSAGKMNEPMHKLEGEVALHPTMLAKEDLALLFGDSEELSEDFRIKAETLFEAAVSTRVNLEVARIEEHYASLQEEIEQQFEQTLEESVEEIKNEMVENVDNYLNYAVAEWINENKLAITNNIRTNMAESFMAGLKNVFEEHYVNIPDDQVDVVETMAEEIESLRNRLNEETEKNIELSKTVNEKEVRDITVSMSEGMTDVQKDKFVKLTEAINYSDAEEFRKKVTIIKETYFPKNGEAVKVVKDQLLSETIEEPAKVVGSTDPDIQALASYISKTVKK